MRHRSFIRAGVFMAFTILIFTIAKIGSGSSDERLIFLPLVTNNYDARWQWLAPATVDLKPATVNFPVTTIDHQGRLHIFWDTLTSPRFIYHAYLTDSGWTVPAPISDTLGTSHILFSPLVDMDGNLHLVWRNWLGPGIENPYRLLYTKFDGEHWDIEEELYRTTNSSVQAMVHLNGQGDVYISLLDGSTSLRAFQLRKDSNVWKVSPPIVPGHLVQWVWPDNQGGIHFYGSDYFNNMSYSYWRSGVFEVHDHESSGMIIGRKTQLDGQNNLHTFWTGTVPIPGSSVTGLYYQCLGKNMAWHPEQILTGQNAVTGTIAKASDETSRVSLAWEEKASAAFIFGIWDGCEQIDKKTVPFFDRLAWDLETIALGKTPTRFCVVAKQLFSSTYAAVCADIDMQ